MKLSASLSRFEDIQGIRKFKSTSRHPAMLPFSG